MRKIVFTWSEGFNNATEEEFEFEDNVPDEDIQNEYDNWLFNIIGDRAGWYEK